MIDFDIFDGFDWHDIGLTGALMEELCDEERERRKIEKDYDIEQEDD